MSDGLMLRDTMVSTENKVPWHGKGTVLAQDHLLSHEVNKYAGLDWRARKVPILMPGSDEEYWPHHRFIVREDTGEAIAVVGAGYEIMQNDEFPVFLDTLIESKDGQFVTAGSLFNQTRTWWLMRQPEHLYVSGDKDEAIQMYLLAVNSFDMSQKAGVYITGVRVVCRNTESLAIGTAKRSSTRKHTKNIKNWVVEAREALGLMHRYGDILVQVSDLLANTPFGDAQVEKTLDAIPTLSLKTAEGEDKTGKALTMASNKRDTFMRVLTNPQADFARHRGTAYAFFNAATEVNDHNGLFRNTDTSDVDDNRFSNVFGLNPAPNLSQQVFNALDSSLSITKRLGLDKKVRV